MHKYTCTSSLSWVVVVVFLLVFCIIPIVRQSFRSPFGHSSHTTDYGIIDEQYKYAIRIVPECEANCGHLETAIEYIKVFGLQESKKRSLRINTQMVEIIDFCTLGWNYCTLQPPRFHSLYLSICISIFSYSIILHLSASEVVDTVASVYGLPFFTHI